MDNDNMIIERFSKKRYITYKAKGIPFHVVSSRGRLCDVKAFDCGDNHDKVLVESTYKLCGKNQTRSHYANQKSGCTGYPNQDGKLFIYRGPWFEYNDLVVCTEDNIRGRYIFLWNKILPKEERFLACWEMNLPPMGQPKKHTPCSLTISQEKAHGSAILMYLSTSLN